MSHLNDLLQTPLNALHLELGARMVPFAGYAMPVQYPAGLMAELFSGDGRRLLDGLIARGYLERRSSGRGSAQPPASETRQAATPPAAIPLHGEGFHGSRSLASARMFLFDLSERLFAPRDKELAARYRDALREARDPQAMLAVGRALIADVEALAGAERADAVIRLD